MNRLESRKQLLIAESDLNRAQMVQEWQTMADGVRSVAVRAASVTSLASAAALLIAGLVHLRQTRSAASREKPSRWRTLLQGALLAEALWTTFRRGENPKRDQ